MSNQQELKYLIELCTMLDGMFWNEDFDKVDELLRNVDVSKESTLNLTGWCRYTFCAHKNLKEWKNFVNTVAAELQKRGEDSQRILRGLL